MFYKSQSALMSKYLLCIISFFTYFSASSQKSSPVAGDAAVLIDLLKKDYNSVSPETKADEIARDRAKAIALFKSYYDGTLSDQLTTSGIAALNITGLSDDSALVITEKNKLEANLKNYNDAKKKLSDIKSLNISTNGIDIDDFNGIATTYTNNQKAYFDSRYYHDAYSLMNLHKAYHENSYLQHMLTLFIKKYSYIQGSKIDVYASVNHQSSIQKSLPFLGGDLAFETIIDGLSRFLAKRIKEELTTYVIDKIKEELHNPKPESYVNEFMVLLPVTTEYIKSFEAHQVLNFIDETKQYIEEDLNNLLNNAAGLKNTPRFKELIDHNPDLDFAFEALEIYPQLSKIKNPVDYFDMLDNSRNIARWRAYDDEPIKFNIANSLGLASMVAHSLTVLENSELKFVSTDFMSNYGAELEFYFLYAGFLNQQHLKYYGIEFITKNAGKKALLIKGLMDNIPPSDIANAKIKANIIHTELTRIATHAEKIHSNALAIKKAKNKNEEISIDEVHSFIDGIIDFAQQITISGDVFLSTAKDLKILSGTLEFSMESRTEPYFSTAHTSNDIMLDLHHKKFSMAIIKTLEIPSNFSTHKFSIHKMMTIQNSIRNARNLRFIKDILKHPNLPSKKKYVAQITSSLIYLEAAVLREKAALTDDDSEASNITYLNTLSTNLASFKSNITDSSIDKEAYKESIIDLKKIITDNFENILGTIAKIDIANDFITPIKGYLNKHNYDTVTVGRITSHIENHIKLSFEKMVIEGKMDGKDLTNDDDYVTSVQNMTRELEAFLPEIANKVFHRNNKNLIKTIHFINDIALSETAEDVETAIDAFALPSGSYALKKKLGHYIAINAFPGVLGGFEQRSINDATLNSIGFTAPIGLYTKLHSKVGLGLFIPIIDIGAPVRFRLDSDHTTTTLPEFSIKNILSPGLYMTWSPWQSPVTFNIGAQYGPELQVINDDDTISTFDDSFRIGFGITLDIPLITLYNRPR